MDASGTNQEIRARSFRAAGASALSGTSGTEPLFTITAKVFVQR
jgi:hypothetical protein